MNCIILDKENTKSGKIRDIPINFKLYQILSAMDSTRKGLVFPSPITGTAYDNIKKSWASLMKKA
jgi:integrase